MTEQRVPPSNLGVDNAFSFSFTLGLRGRRNATAGAIDTNPLVACASLLDDRNGARSPLSQGYLVPGSRAQHAQLMQSITELSSNDRARRSGTFGEVKFKDMVIRVPGTYRIRVTLMRMVDGTAEHIARYDSAVITVTGGVANGVKGGN